MKIPIFDVHGKIEGIQGIFWDVTARKRLEEDLRQVNITLENRVRSELERARKQEQLLIQQSKMAEMGNMIGAIVHQWKQPITSIHMMAELVDEDAELGSLEPKNVSKHMHNIIGQVDFMSKTMNDFRNYFLPSKTKKQFLLKKSIEDLYAMLKKGFTNHDVAVTIQGDENISAFGYDNEFKQVLLNILNNANDVFIESKRKDGKIEIDIRSEGERAIITITDNGGGIASELLPEKIFEPYITTKGEKRTGIGLSMSKSIIENNMGGELMVRNVEGGAEFTIELPMSEKPEQTKYELGILYAEDEEIARKTMHNFLEKSFTLVETASSGLEALDKYNLNPKAYQLIISDFNMPGMDGLELLQSIHRQNADVKCIMMTAFIDDLKNNISQECILLEKPIRKDELIRMIKKLFELGY